MVDVFTPEKRSAVMSRIRGRDTRPELTVRRILHAQGYRFTVKGPSNRLLPGRPDIVLPKHRTVVMVHGCFWHAHEGCKDFRIPKTRTEWWEAKLMGNRARDQRVESELQKLGWRVVTVWACALRTSEQMVVLQRSLPVLIEGPSEVPRVAEDERPYRIRT